MCLDLLTRILEHGLLAHVTVVFCQCWPVALVSSDVVVVSLDSGPDGSTGWSNVHIVTPARDAVHAWEF